MKKLVTLFFFVVTVAQAGTPVIDPDTCYSNYPFAQFSNQTWYAVDSTNRVSKQLWLTLVDRARAAGVENLPAFEKTVNLYAGIKTNWVYEDWAIWNSTITNNYLTNWNPTLQLLIISNMWNAVTSFSYAYPKDPGTDYSGTNIATAYMTLDMKFWGAVQGGIESISQYYIPASVTLSDYTNGFPTYCMAQLLTDAACADLVSNTVTDTQGTITNGLWNWRYPIPSTNGMVELRAIDDLCACIAQLKKTKMQARGCAPYVLKTDIGIGQNYGWGNLITMSITNIGYFDSTVFRNPDRFPFAWMQQSTDTTWGASLAFDDAGVWTSNNWSSGIGYAFDKHSDWTNSGWFGKATYSIDYTAHRDGTNVESGSSGTNNGGWAWSAGDSSEKITTNQEDITHSWVQTFVVPEYSNRALTIKSKWLYGAYEENVPEHDETTYSDYYIRLSNTSSWVTENFTRSKVGETVEGTTNYQFICRGYYQRHTNATHTNAPWTDYVEFTNTETIARTFGGSNEVTLTSSNYTTFTTSTNYTRDITGSQHVDAYTRTVQQEGGDQPHSGTADPTYSSQENGVWTFAAMYSIRTDTRNVWTNAGTGYLYVVGGSFGSVDGHSVNTSDAHSEWTATETGHTWRYSDAGELGILGGLAVTNGKHTLIKTYEMDSDMITDNFGLSMLINSQFMSSASAYTPFWENATHSRLFWGIGNAFFVLDYTFPIR